MTTVGAPREELVQAHLTSLKHKVDHSRQHSKIFAQWAAPGGIILYH